MTDKVTLNTVTSFVNDSSAATAFNDNMAAITTAMDNTLSRDGTTPNEMEADLDMNSFQIINLPAPSTLNSPARLADITVANQSLNIPTTGTSGHTVPYLDGNNTWSGTTNTFGGTVDLQSASFVNSPTAPTPTLSDNSTKLATTAFVKSNATSFGTIAGLSVLGTAGSATAAPGVITGTANQILGVNAAGNALAFETVSGDATQASGALTLATVNASPGASGSSTAIPTVTVNGKGLVTAVTTNAVVAPAGTLSGTTLNATVVNSTLHNTSNTLALGADAASPTSSAVHAQNVVAGTSNTPGVDLVVAGGNSTGTGAGGKVKVQTAPVGSSGTSQNTLTDRITVDSPGNVVVGPAIIATNATDGFLYIPTCAGPATGTPTAYGGRAPLVFDSTNNKLYIYNPASFAWKSTVALT